MRRVRQRITAYATAVAVPVVVYLFCGIAAAQPSVVASVDKTEVGVEELFIITVTAEGGGRIAEPVIPHSDEIRFNRTPLQQSSSTSIQIINGRPSRLSQRQWTFRAWAAREGELTIPPISVRIDDKNYLTEAIRIRAVKRASSPIPVPEAQRPQPRAEDRARSDRMPTLDDAVRIESTVNKQRVYQGEAVQLELRILTLNMAGVRAQYNGRSIPPPSTEGFYALPPVQEERMETRDGWEYRTTLVRQLLFPTGAGTFEIGAWHWEGYIWGYTREGPYQTYKALSTPPIEITVRPLPPRPDNFSGAVGQFKVTANLLQTDVMQGTPTQLSVRVRGEGNSDAIGPPHLPPIPWAQVSGPEIETKPFSPDEWGQVEKVFNYTILPLEAGERIIPEITFCYFAPAIGQYRTERVPPFSVHVNPAREGDRLLVVGGAQEPAETRVTLLSEDIYGIVTHVSGLRPQRSGAATNAVAGFAPPLAYGALFLFTRRQRRFAADSRYARNRRARARARKRLKEMLRSEAPADVLYSALTGYLADKFDVNEAGMTSEDARLLLETRHAPDDIMENCLKVLRVCERERYAAARLNADELGALACGAETVMDRLEEFLKKGAKS